MKKVYLLTFHGSVNYGAVLQAYALNKTIIDMGYDCEVIDYNRELHHQNFLRIQKSGLKSVIYQLLKRRHNKVLHKKFDNFTKSMMTLSNKSYNGFGALNDTSFDKNDVYLIGSDQVWNCQLTENNYHYYLDFTDSNNKYSYASSFGVADIDNFDDKDYVIDLLSKFKRISVREESGCDIIKKHLGMDSTVVCDPTFLLDNSQWSEIAQSSKETNYIALFMLNRNEKLIAKAKELSKEKNLKIVNLAYTVKGIEGIEDVKCLSPQQWLGYIKNAEYVFTNSFHGFALSLNFNRQVFVALTEGGRNSRITDLCERYGVSDRIINDSMPDNDINYEQVNQKINENRICSKAFLEEILNESTNG